jgi:transcriptional regulator of acetoin/glycerol metabolism
VVARRLLDHAGLTPPPRRVTSARQRRDTTDQRLTTRAAELGFVSLQAYLVDRATRQEWPLPQVASELGIDRNTVRDRLDRHGLRRTKQTAP